MGLSEPFHHVGGDFADLLDRLLKPGNLVLLQHYGHREGPSPVKTGGNADADVADPVDLARYVT